jgi:signal transduction histidine kinase
LGAQRHRAIAPVCGTVERGVAAKEDDVRGALAWTTRGSTAVGRGLVLGALALVAAALAIGSVLALVLLIRFGGHAFRVGDPRLVAVLVLIPAGVAGVRPLARLTRSLAGPWCHVQIATPYRRARLRAGWLLADPATWRDMFWAVVSAAGGWLVAAAPAVLVAAGLVVIVRFGVGLTVSHNLSAVPGAPPGIGRVTRIPQLAHVVTAPSGLAILFGLACIALGLWSAPPLVRAYGSLARYFLAPTRGAELAHRVHHLAQTRSDTIDAGAAEMRRIERDLHDGAQARLVAMGMTLDAAGELVETDPAAARALLAEARDASAKALAELRDLVRGIHPPVLADRGLAEAIRALALECPVRAELAGGLPGRPPLAVESAAYFAVSELLANVVKHSGARRAWIDVRHEGGALRIGVTDDGHGGADPAAGTGLRGVERRLAAFDGVLAVSSPAGGPTVVNVELPCEL